MDLHAVSVILPHFSLIVNDAITCGVFVKRPLSLDVLFSVGVDGTSMMTAQSPESLPFPSVAGGFVLCEAVYRNVPESVSINYALKITESGLSLFNSGACTHQVSWNEIQLVSVLNLSDKVHKVVAFQLYDKPRLVRGLPNFRLVRPSRIQYGLGGKLPEQFLVSGVSSKAKLRSGDWMVVGPSGTKSNGYACVSYHSWA